VKSIIPAEDFRLLVSNIFFTLLQPGMVAVLIPYWILRSLGEWVLPVFPSWSILGVFMIVPGLIILLMCIADFARKGKGTLSPADPTKKLVLGGLYRYSRNPMYVGVLMILTGEAILFQSPMLAGYSLLIFLVFFGFVVWFEEPRLKRDFGEEYVAYMQAVRRWL